MKDHLVGIKNCKLVMAKDILCTFALVLDVGSGWKMAHLLGMERKNIAKAQGRRSTLDAAQDSFWLYNWRKPRCNLIPEDVKAMV